MKDAFMYSFKKSLPIMFGWIPLGLAYGLLMNEIGFGPVWTLSCSVFVFAGALQFLMLTFLAGGVSYLTVFIMALLLNSRHIFYGLPFIEKFREFTPIQRFLLIFTLGDEAFSLHCSNNFRELYPDADERSEKWTYLFSAILVLSYWAILSLLGALIGALLPFDLNGMDFALTALFTVITIEQLKAPGAKIPVIIAMVSSIACLVIIGSANFLLPSLAITMAVIVLFRNKLEPAFEIADAGAAGAELAENADDVKPADDAADDVKPADDAADDVKPADDVADDAADEKEVH